MEQAGFVFDALANKKAVISAIPVALKENDVLKVFVQLIDDIQNEVPDFNFSSVTYLPKLLRKV